MMKRFEICRQNTVMCCRMLYSRTYHMAGAFRDPFLRLNRRL